MAGGFNSFDDNDGFDISFGDDDQQDASQDTDSEFGDFGQSQSGDAQTVDETTQDKSTLIKISVIIIVIAIMIIAIVFKVVGGSGKNKHKDTDNASNNNIENVQVDNNHQVSNPDTNSGSNDGWISITGEDNITFSESAIPSNFTITAIKHYAKVVDSNKNLKVKTLLTGTLDGFTGTYELEVPYSKGCQLKVGQNFSVDVEVGSYNGKTVIGNIHY